MEFAIIATVILIVLAIITIISAQQVGKLTQELKTARAEKDLVQTQAHSLQMMLDQEKVNNQTIISQKKSSETRLGQISENITPFLEAYPYDPKNSHFLGQPIDFIVFDYDDGKIVFLEVKTGGAKESHRQRLIKNIIKSGRVYYEKLRINEKGAKIKRERNDDEQA